jgi:excinuclease UvrABC nuclease subunit
MKRFVRFDAQTLEYLKTFPVCPGIYLISCEDGTCYLGATKNLQRRIRGHLSHSGRFTGSVAHVIETLDEYCVEKLRVIEDSYLAAFSFEHNSLVASPYSYTAKCK